jgi:hypothetical protein
MTMKIRPCMLAKRDERFKGGDGLGGCFFPDEGFKGGEA